MQRFNSYVPIFPGILTWELLHPMMNDEYLGFIPSFLSSEDSRCAAEQIDQNYISGWRPTGTSSKFEHRGEGALKYPGDPVMKPIAKAQLRHETIYFYEHEWLAIFQPDGSFEIDRLD